MTNRIENDRQLREAINSLSTQDQRRLGALFASEIAHLSQQPAVVEGLRLAADSSHTPSEREAAYREVKQFTLQSRTACGSDADWLAQAEHFLAAAVTACLAPEEQFALRENPAWRAAMQCRMARNCEQIENDNGPEENEPDRQYRIASAFLS